MPEIPDLEAYRHAIRHHLVGHTLTGIRLLNPFLLRSVDPPLTAFAGSVLRDIGRLGKRLVFVFDDERFLVLHLMIAGRLQYRAKPGAKAGGRIMLAGFDFDDRTLVLTEAGKKRRASLFAVQGQEALAAHDPGGLEIDDLDNKGFGHRLKERNHTLKRALTDPRIFSGIGNAYSDEILHQARLSPFLQTQKMSDDDVKRLFDTIKQVLSRFTKALIDECGDGFPGKVTAFREDMAVHGRYGQPCPVCQSKVQRIAYAGNETNYCATCQTGGRLFADRALSRLLKKDWPKTLDQLEALKAEHRSTD